METEDNSKILAIGAATQDVFLTGKALTAKRDVRTHSYIEQFPLGAKIDLDHVFFDTGGGATNAAVTFARQGLKAGFVGKIGHDPAGNEVLRVLHKEGVSTDHVAYDPKLSTGYSVLLVATNGERTILSYRGASHAISARDFSIKTLKADWLYISSLAGNIDLLSKLLKHSSANGIKVAFNPGAKELSNPRKLRALLGSLEVLVANREELAQLYGGDNGREVIVNALGVCPYVVMTDGPSGVYVGAEQHIYFAGQYQRVRVVDRTGAGDAFGSGFVAAIAKGLPIEEAITLASANSTSVVQQIGAKTGILRTSRLKRMKVRTLSL